MTDTDDERGRDVELAHEEAEADGDEEDPSLEEARQEAQRERSEQERRQDIEHESTDRETDALQTANPDKHRDEAPENS